MASSLDRQSLLESLDLYLVDDMPVVAADGYNVGPVKMYSAAAGYLLVEHGAFDHEDLYIPFRLISGIDQDEVVLSKPRDVVVAQYTMPPKITTVTEERLVRGPSGALTSQKRDVQSVQSGYDGLAVTINGVDVTNIADQLAVGMVVYDLDGRRSGEITQYDIPRQLLVVEQGVVKPKALFVSLGAIRAINQDDLTVFLSLPRDVLVKEQAMLPKDAKDA